MLAQRFLNIGGADWFNPSGLEIMQTNFVRRTSNASITARDWDLLRTHVFAEPGIFGTGDSGGGCGETYAHQTDALLLRQTRVTSTPLVYLGGTGGIAYTVLTDFTGGACTGQLSASDVPLEDVARYSSG